MQQYRTKGICFEATLKLPFVNLKKGQHYQVLIYDNGAPSSPMMEVSDQVVNTTSPTAYLHGSYFDDNYSVTVVVFPLQGSSTPDGYNVNRFADVPLSAWQDYEGELTETMNSTIIVKNMSGEEMKQVIVYYRDVDYQGNVLAGRCFSASTTMELIPGWQEELETDQWLKSCVIVNVILLDEIPE